MRNPVNRTDRLKRNTISRLLLSSVLIAASLVQCDFATAEVALPPIVTAGVEAYKTGGAQAAISAWLKGSPLEGERQAQLQSALLLQIESVYGKFVSAVPIATFEPSPGVTLLFVGLRYEKGPVFAKFLTFKAGEKEVLVSFKFNTTPEEILPGPLLYKSK